MRSSTAIPPDPTSRENTRARPFKENQPPWPIFATFFCRMGGRPLNLNLRRSHPPWVRNADERLTRVESFVHRASFVSRSDSEALIEAVERAISDRRVGIFVPQSISWKINRESALL